MRPISRCCGADREAAASSGSKTATKASLPRFPPQRLHRTLNRSLTKHVVQMGDYCAVPFTLQSNELVSLLN